MKTIMTVNPGSTGTKYKVFDLSGNLLKEKTFSLKEEKQEKIFFSDIKNLQKIAIRSVHGGDLTETLKVNKKIKEKIQLYQPFAPIHNARSLESIQKMEDNFSNIDIYACFDTAFHTDINKALSSYALPVKLVKKYKLKKYGFHGLAVESALSIFKEKKGKTFKKYKKIIVVHLGGGCSITAVKNGKSFATTMELTPLSGIMMTTRSGNIDPEIIMLLLDAGFSRNEITEFLNYKSGFFGLTGTKDTLKIFNHAKEGKDQEKLAFDIFVNQIIEKIYGFTGLMQGVDAILFTGGIGFGNEYLRNTIIKKLSLLGLKKSDIYPIHIDEGKMMFEKVKRLK